MQCELCGKNEATVHFKAAVQGDLQELFICPSCAATKGVAVQNPAAFAQFMLGAVPQPQEDADPVEVVCPGCHLRESDLRKTQRLGCSRCYEAFEAILAPMIESMHPQTDHRGKVPERFKPMAELKALEDALAAAVSEQRFEDAGRLRDQIALLRDAASSQGGRT